MNRDIIDNIKQLCKYNIKVDFNLDIEDEYIQIYTLYSDEYDDIAHWAQIKAKQVYNIQDDTNEYRVYLQVYSAKNNSTQLAKIAILGLQEGYEAQLPLVTTLKSYRSQTTRTITVNIVNIDQVEKRINLVGYTDAVVLLQNAQMLISDAGNLGWLPMQERVTVSGGFDSELDKYLNTVIFKADQFPSTQNHKDDFLADEIIHKIPKSKSSIQAYFSQMLTTIRNIPELTDEEFKEITDSIKKYLPDKLLKEFIQVEENIINSKKSTTDKNTAMAMNKKETLADKLKNILKGKGTASQQNFEAICKEYIDTHKNQGTYILIYQSTEDDKKATMEQSLKLNLNSKIVDVNKLYIPNKQDLGLDKSVTFRIVFNGLVFDFPDLSRKLNMAQIDKVIFNNCQVYDYFKVAKIIQHKGKSLNAYASCQMLPEEYKAKLEFNNSKFRDYIDDEKGKFQKK